MTMNHKLLFIDIDGTLFDHEKDTIAESAKEAILSAKSKGHKIFLSTGRPYADIDKEILDFPLDGMIVSCGAVVYVENKPIYCKTYPQEELINLIQFMIVKCSQFPSCVDFTGFNCIQNCVYCYYLSFFSKIALKHRPHYFHI